VSTLEWQKFQRGALDSVALSTVRPEILGSWSRSRAVGVDPEHLGIRHVDVDLDSAFLRAGSRVLLSMADVLVGTNTSLALTDPTGNILWRWEGERSLGLELDRTEIGVGSSMGERNAGTNGIAVALAERRPATVVGSEHYKAPWHGWSCAAAPVVHPVLGRVAGAVNITCRAEDANHLLLVVLRSLVNAVRGALDEAASTRERRLMDAHMSFCAVAQAPVVTLDDRTMIVNDDAAALELNRSILWARLLDASPLLSAIPVDDDHLGVGHQIVEGHPEEGFVVVLHRRFEAEAAPVVMGPSLHFTPLEVAERRVIVQALHDHHGNKSDVAVHLGISRGTLYERLRRYGLN
jgi:transcriptional regulator of acetoin/glycerol metabolism